MKSFIKLSAIALASLMVVSTVSASGTSYSAPAKKTPTKTSYTQKLKLDKVQIQLIQYALKDLGHNPGPIDGQWGSSSAKAVRAYQASVGASQSGSLNVKSSCYLLQVGIANHGSSAKMPSWCGFK